MSEPQHFLHIDDLTPTELEHVLDVARDRRGEPVPTGEAPPLERQTLGMIFEKPSTRTRVSFETGMTHLGGHAVFLGPDDTQLGRGEPLRDTSRALSGYVDAIMARVFDHEDVAELARFSAVPVINGLSDVAHPCQALADLLTIADAFGDFEDVSAAWVGDGNNVARSFAVGSAMVGMDLTVATPPGYGIGDDVIERAGSYDTELTVTTSPEEAVADADVIYTDVWVSMGEDDERRTKLAAFEGFQINQSLLSRAPADAVVMHCLPAHRDEEITDAVMESDRTIVWTQAANRLHAQKGLLCYLLEADERGSVDI